VVLEYGRERLYMRQEEAAKALAAEEEITCVAIHR
jgi:hypothetical protein